MAKQDGPTQFVPLAAVGGNDDLDDNPPSVHSSEFDDDDPMDFQNEEHKAASINLSSAESLPSEVEVAINSAAEDSK